MMADEKAAMWAEVVVNDGGAGDWVWLVNFYRGQYFQSQLIGQHCPNKKAAKEAAKEQLEAIGFKGRVIMRRS